MIVRVVGFQKTIGMPNFSNDRPLVVEADLEEGETMEQAWSKMNQAAIDWHKAEYPHLYQEEKTFTKVYEGGTIGNPNLTPPIIQRQEDFHEPDALSGILAASTLNELKTYKIVASADKTLYNAYNQRLKELTQ